jgi:hypothetical protein
MAALVRRRSPSLWRHFRTRTEARMAVFDDLEGFYNPTAGTPPSASSAPPTTKGATCPDTLQHSPDPSTEPGQLQGISGSASSSSGMIN